MAKNGQYNGQLAEALRLLDRPDKADKASLAKALKQARGAGAITDAQLIERYGHSEFFTVDASIGRLVVSVGPGDDAPSWLDQAHTTAVKLAPPVATYDDRWQDWKLPHTPNRTHQGISNELRGKGNAAQKLSIIALQPTVRLATLTATDHLHGRGGPYPSYQNAFQTLEVSAAQKSLTGKQGGFTETLAPEYDVDKQLFEVYADTDATLVRARRFMGSYYRDSRVLNRSRHAQLHTTQSMNLMQQTVFAVDPEWGEILVGRATPQGFERVKEESIRQELGSFIADQEIMTPLASSLHVQQRHEILRTSPA